MLRPDMSLEVLLVPEGVWTLVACERTRVFLEMFATESVKILKQKIR
jgi:hypothetical protein